MHTCLQGGLNSRLWPGSHGYSEVKPLKAIIVLKWATFLVLGFRCTLPPIAHPILMGVCRLDIFQCLGLDSLGIQGLNFKGSSFVHIIISNTRDRIVARREGSNFVMQACLILIWSSHPYGWCPQIIGWTARNFSKLKVTKITYKWKLHT